ncbi:IPTL-CTERM sorting domain-containing protein [Diaphorobacter caeni]|uniref:IPTL-CTERM sorting domain-containing protein n=1 Tax=Diaphorobacter caeni TaxID=2784387 RepID=UPI00188F4E68|nr:IPTL-CTERM sorting domain-containing protein [Diaphorobacter caeni]MBF5006562.1 IPTL-CTERM sorting domain-containing protein [Diaphorobacter caeni]
MQHPFAALIRALGGTSLVLMGVAAHAQTNVPAPTPPVLTCNTSSTAANVVHNLRDAFNTSNAGAQYNGSTLLYTFPNDSRRYWQAGVEKRFPRNAQAYPLTGSDGVTGSRNVASSTALTGGSGFYDPYPTMPAIDGNWVVMGDQATSGYGSTGENGQKVGMNGQAVQLNHNPNVMYYYKFTFTMDSLMDVNQFGININNMNYGTGLWNSDDRLKGIYVNGQLVGTTNNGGNLSSFSPTSASYTASMAAPGNTFRLPTNTAWKVAHPTAQPLWASGTNTIVFAIMNGGMRSIAGNNDSNFADNTTNTTPSGVVGTSGMNTSQSLLKMLDTSLVQTCIPAIAAPATAASQTSADALNFSGTVTNAITDATTVNVTVRDAGGNVVGVYAAAIDPVTNTYSFVGTGPSGLPPGNYTADATLVNPNDPTGPGVVLSGPTPFTVTAPAITMTQPPNIAAGTTNTITGTVPNKGAATTVDIVLRDAGGNVVDTFLGVLIQPDGSYSVPTNALPVGNYLVEATITGVPPTAAIATSGFSVSAVTVTPPPTHTTTEPSTITGNVQYPGTATTVHVVVTDPNGAKVYEGDVPLDASGNYTVPLNALPTKGTYSITSTVNGAMATGQFEVVQTAVTVGPQPTVDSKQPSHIAGTVTNPGPANTVEVKITDGTGTVVWQGTAPLNPDGTYAVDSSALPKGDYTVTATANGSSATTPLKVTDPPTEVTVTPPGTLTPTQKPNVGGTVQYPGTATSVDLSITDSTGKVVWQGTATLNADGSYSTQAQALPLGDYTVTATVNGKSATTTFSVVAAPVPAPVPTLGQGALVLLSAMLAVFGALRQRRTSRT